MLGDNAMLKAENEKKKLKTCLWALLEGTLPTSCLALPFEGSRGENN